jgi:hypothetical protein
MYPNRGIIDSFINGFIKAAAANSFSVKLHPNRVSINYDYADKSSLKLSPSYAGVRHTNSAPTSLTATPAKYTSSINLAPGQVKNMLGNVGQTDSQPYKMFSGWDKYQDFVDAPNAKRIVGLKPRPILTHDEISATQPLFNNMSTLDVAKGVVTDPAARHELKGALTQPYTTATALEATGTLTGGALGNIMSKTAPPLVAAGLLSNLFNEASKVPEQVVSAGGVAKYLDNQSAVNSNFTSAPGYVRHVADNLAKPVSAVVGVENDLLDLIKLSPGVARYLLDSVQGR